MVQQAAPRPMTATALLTVTSLSANQLVKHVLVPPPMTVLAALMAAPSTKGLAPAAQILMPSLVSPKMPPSPSPVCLVLVLLGT